MEMGRKCSRLVGRTCCDFYRVFAPGGVTQFSRSSAPPPSPLSLSHRHKHTPSHVQSIFRLRILINIRNTSTLTWHPCELTSSTFSKFLPQTRSLHRIPGRITFLFPVLLAIHGAPHEGCLGNGRRQWLSHSKPTIHMTLFRTPTSVP